MSDSRPSRLSAASRARLTARAKVVSASGLAGTDQYHFDLAGQRLLGMRYGQQMISALGL